MQSTFKAIMLLSADTPSLLRPVDVDRVMEAALDMGILDGFRAWLLESDLQEATRKNVKMFEA
jgi:hypothetical protein